MSTLIKALNHLEAAKKRIKNGFPNLAIGTIDRVVELIKNKVEQDAPSPTLCECIHPAPITLSNGPTFCLGCGEQVEGAVDADVIGLNPATGHIAIVKKEQY